MKILIQEIYHFEKFLIQEIYHRLRKLLFKKGLFHTKFKSIPLPNFLFPRKSKAEFLSELFRVRGLVLW